MEVAVPDLTSEQVEAVLAESLHRAMWELDVDGNPPRDFKDREKAAKDLLHQCVLAHAAGNRMDSVLALLHIAEYDGQQVSQKPDTGGLNMAATADVDLAQHPLDALQKFETTLLGYPQDNEEVQQNLVLVRAEIARKGGGTSAPPAAAAAPVAEVAPEPPAVVVVQETISDQAVQTGQAEVAESAALRKSLEDRLTFPMMRAHSIDPSQIPTLTDGELQWIVEHPGGDVSTQSPAAPIPPAPEPQGETLVTTQMVINREPEAQPAPPVSAVPAEVPQATTTEETEREELESQVTGPILKAYGRGRTDVPDIGINELTFMIANPEGRVTKDQLLAAQALDGAASAEEAEEAQKIQPTIAEQTAPEPEMVVTKEVLGPEQVDHFLPTAENAAQTHEYIVGQIGDAAIVLPVSNIQSEASKTDFDDRAQEIIDREHFPIPADIEKPPRMPNDMSGLSKDELYSIHAQFHACEARANWVLTEEDEKVYDLQKFLAGREVEVRNEAPTKDPDDARKRLTDAQRDALVAADGQVKEIKTQLHKALKTVRKLKVLRDNYHKDVERASRQMTRFTEEREGAR